MSDEFKTIQSISYKDGVIEVLIGYPDRVVFRYSCIRKHITQFVYQDLIQATRIYFTDGTKKTLKDSELSLYKFLSNIEYE